MLRKTQSVKSYFWSVHFLVSSNYLNYNIEYIMSEAYIFYKKNAYNTNKFMKRLIPIGPWYKKAVIILQYWNKREHK